MAKAVVFSALLTVFVFRNAEAQVVTPNLPVVEWPDLPFTVTCNYTLSTSQQMHSLVSLIVSRDQNPGSGNPKELASITNFRPNTANVDPGFTGNAYGQFGNNGGDSYIVVEYPTPGESEAGEYFCSAQGIDHFGRPLVEKASTTVGFNQLNYTILREKILDLNEQVRACRQGADESKIQQLSQRLRDVTAHVENLDADITGVSDLKDNSTSFYLVTHPNMTLAQAQAACARYGGYMAEINNEEEYNTVTEILQHPDKIPPGVNAFITGAKYDANLNWAFETHTELPVYKDKFFPGEPDLLGPPNIWLLVYNLGNGDIGMADGPIWGNNRAILCEITL